MIDRLRFWLWRHRVALAVAWVASLAAVATGIWFYAYRVPPALDVGLTVALRQVAHRATFREVEIARRALEEAASSESETERARLEDQAVERLELFLLRHRSVQPDRLETQSVVAATELLAAHEARRGRHGRAVRLLGVLAASDSENYRVHWLLADAHAARGDLPEASAAYRAAFKLAPNHVGVTEGFLDVLSVQNAFADIVWVAEHFDRAVRRGAPSAEVKVGPARGSLQRAVLEWSGVPVEHGSYVRAATLFGLARGPRCTLVPPADLLRDWTHGGPLFVQVRFEGIYDGLVIGAFRYWTADGAARELPLDAERLSTFHRPHSGVEWYAEFRTDLDPRDVARFEIDYECPQLELGRTARGIVDKARTNLGARR